VSLLAQNSAGSLAVFSRFREHNHFSIFPLIGKINYCHHKTKFIRMILKISVPIAQETNYISFTRSRLLMHFKEMVSIHCESCTDNKPCVKNADVFNVNAGGTNSYC
jgi:hypothetical protein